MDKQEYIANMLTTDEIVSLLNKMGRITHGNCRVVATHDIANTYFESNNVKEQDIYFIENALFHLPYIHEFNKVKGRIDFNSPKTLMNSSRGLVNDIDYLYTLHFKANNKEYKEYLKTKNNNKEIVK